MVRAEDIIARKQLLDLLAVSKFFILLYQFEQPFVNFRTLMRIVYAYSLIIMVVSYSGHGWWTIKDAV